MMPMQSIRGAFVLLLVGLSAAAWAGIGVSAAPHRHGPIVVTGFEPFGGSNVNASWEAAASLIEGPTTRTVFLAPDGATRTLHIARMPVVWGEPAPGLAALCDALAPQLVIAMGEAGRPFFSVEAIADNRRAPYRDNHGHRPYHPRIEPGGPERLAATAPVEALAAALTARGFPTRVSGEAGDYLCEEMLYVLERRRAADPHLRHVVFVHVPVLGTPLAGGADLDLPAPTCDKELLARFARALVEETWRLTRHEEQPLGQTQTQPEDSASTAGATGPTGNE